MNNLPMINIKDLYNVEFQVQKSSSSQSRKFELFAAHYKHIGIKDKILDYIIRRF